MKLVLRLVKTGIDGSSRSVDVLEIVRRRDGNRQKLTHSELGFADLRRFAGDADQAVEEPVGIFCTVPVIR